MKLEYKSNMKINIPNLKSKGGIGLKLPLIDYNTMKVKEEQIIEVSNNEAADLQRCWPGCFTEVKEVKEIKIEKEEIEDDM